MYTGSAIRSRSRLAGSGVAAAAGGSGVLRTAAQEPALRAGGGCEGEGTAARALGLVLYYSMHFWINSRLGT